MNKRTSDAKFIGTEEDFLDLFGPTLLTNAVKSYAAKSRKAAGGICQHCGKEHPLQAAHIAGADRLSLAKQVLKSFPHTADGKVEVDILAFLKLFYQIHQPIEAHVIFLCDACHKAYDKNHGIKPTRRTPGSNPFGGYGRP